MNPQKPTSGRDGQYIDLDKDIGKVIRKELGKEKSREREENMDTGSNINTIAKKETDKYKDDNMKTLENLDNFEKVDKSSKKVLEIDFVDIVLIDSKRANNHTSKDQFNRPKITDGPKYTTLSFTEDNKENIVYEIDAINTTNANQSVNSNDIVENLETIPQRKTQEILTSATGSPEIPTEYQSTKRKTTERTAITVKPTEELKDYTIIQMTTEISLQETKEESQPNKKTEGEFVGTENLIISGK